jgi:hypothetical protein
MSEKTNNKPAAKSAAKKPVKKMPTAPTAPEQEQEQEKQEPNALLISLELAEQIVGYLREKKMSEVEGLVKGIRESRAVTVNQ